MDRVRHYIRAITAHPFAGTETGAVLEAVLGPAGKMIRPRLLLLCGGCGPEREEHLERLCLLAAMVELTHAASLIHDDIIDDAPFRRGAPSVQGRFGKDAAVYAGDFLISRVNYWEAKEGLNGASMVLTGAVEQMCLGEIGQAGCRFRTDVTEAQYLSNIRGKTASLFSAACILGARESGCPPETVETLGLLGENIGLMFQLRDDLLDFISTEEAEGKETQKDFRDGIYTLPVLLALHSPEGRAKLLPLMEQNREAPLAAEALRRMEEAVLSSGGVEGTRQKIHGICRESLGLLECLEPREAGDKIRELIQKLDAI